MLSIAPSAVSTQGIFFFFFFRELLLAVTAKMKRLHILAAISRRFHFGSIAVEHSLHVRHFKDGNLMGCQDGSVVERLPFWLRA